jgi:hypothetical protein
MDGPDARCTGAGTLFVELFLDAHDRPPEEIALDLDATDYPFHGNLEGKFFRAGAHAPGRCHLWHDPERSASNQTYRQLVGWIFLVIRAIRAPRKKGPGLSDSRA